MCTIATTVIGPLKRDPEKGEFFMKVWYGMVDVYDGYLAAEASRSSFG